MYKGLSTIHFEHLFALSTATNTRGHAAKIAKHHCHLDLNDISSQSVLSTVGTTCQYQLQYRQLLSEQNSSYKDGLLHGLTGPHGLST